jgi:hypothetical protein
MCKRPTPANDYGGTAILGLIIFTTLLIVFAVIGGACLGVGLRDTNQALIIAGAVFLALEGLTVAALTLFCFTQIPACWDCCCCCMSDD